MKKLLSSLLIIICFVVLNTYGNDNGSKIASQSQAEVSSDLKVHFLDVGQGDATLLECGGEAMLIDAGENDKGTKIQNYLQKRGIKDLKYVVGTHAHADHIGGMDVIITKFNVETILLSKTKADTRTYDDVIQAMKYKGIKPTYPEIGDTFTLGDAVIYCIGPIEETDDLNNSSLMLLVEHGNDAFLFTGDAEEDSENALLMDGFDREVDVYQAGHHGSSTSSSQDFMNVISPESIIISCEENNSYGHPHQETLSKFRMMEMDVYRTDEDGTIIATSTGDGITFNTPPSTTWKSGEGMKQ